MTTRRHVAVVVTARPSFSRIATALFALQERPDVELSVIVTASALLERYGSAVSVIEEAGLPVAARAFTVVEGENPTVMAKTTGLGMIELATAFERLAPEVVVSIADRYETLATAATAAYMNLPLAHVQGGEITGSIDEKVRHAVTKLADLHLVSTEAAGERVIRMGERPERVFVTGCPSIDLAAEVLAEEEKQKDGPPPFDPFASYGGVGPRLDLSGGYLMVLQHPVTTEHARAREHAFETLHAVREVGLPTLWFWPNVDAGSDGTSNAIRTFRELHDASTLHFFKNVPPRDFLRLMRGARALVGNSSAGIREASFLGAPAVNIGTRQAGRDRGPNVLDVPYDRREIAAAIRRQMDHGPYPSAPVYGRGDAGERMAEVLATAPLSIEKRLTY